MEIIIDLMLLEVRLALVLMGIIIVLGGGGVRLELGIMEIIILWRLEMGG
jgi:hypothetical protein